MEKNILDIQNIIKNISIINNLNLKNKTFVGVLKTSCVNISPDLLNYLPKGRFEYANNFKNEERKKQSIAADIILIYFLKKFFNVKNINITNNNYIKLNKTKVYFNKSHSRDLAVCVVSNNAVGIDIQYHKNIKFPQKIAKKYFNKNEISLIKKKSDFFDIWAKKEAQVKLFGKGIDNISDIYCSNINFVSYKKIKNYSMCIAQV